jgi:hypothetical protein
LNFPFIVYYLFYFILFIIFYLFYFSFFSVSVLLTVRCVLILKSRIRQRYRSDLEAIAEGVSETAPHFREQILAFLGEREWTLSKALLKEWV